MSTVARLTAEFAAVKINKSTATPQPKRRSRYHSPEHWATGLKPMCPKWTQSRAAYLRGLPFWAHCPQLLDYLKVRPFPLASHPRGITTRRRKVTFDDIINVAVAPPKEQQQTTLSPSEERRYLSNVTFRKVLHQHKIGKLRIHRRFRRSNSTNGGEADQTPQHRGFAAPIRTKPFDDEVEIDPFIFNPELQFPFSPLKNDSARYLEEDRLQREGKELTYCQRRLLGESPFTPGHIKDMIHRTLGMGKYAWKRVSTSPKASPLRVEEVEDDEEVIVGSPMDVDEVFPVEGSPMKIDGITG